IVRRERGGEKEFGVRSSLLTAGRKATIVTVMRSVKSTKFARVRRARVDVDIPNFAVDDADVTHKIIAPVAAQVEPQFTGSHLVIVHDSYLSRVPWETLSIGDSGNAFMPAAGAGLSHLYAAENLSVAKWLEERLHDDLLNLLLVVDPTRDLQGAREEGRAIQQMFAGRAWVQIDMLYQGEATRPALLDAFGS